MAFFSFFFLPLQGMCPGESLGIKFLSFGHNLLKKILFQKFSEAAEVYTKCIEEGKDADPKFLATLHQNRAAANKVCLLIFNS